jgi:hypothetical protein
MSNESSNSKLGFHANASNSPSLTPTSSSPVTINGGDQSSMHSNGNGNGMLNDGKLTSNHYQNGGLPDLQATFQGSSWSHVLDPLTGTSGDHHPFDVHNTSRLFPSQTSTSNVTTSSTPPPLMAMQQQQQQQQQQQMPYQQVDQTKDQTLSSCSVTFLGYSKTTDHCVP